MKIDLSTYNNDWFKPGRSKSIQLIWYCCNAFFLNSYLVPVSSFKVFLLKLFGAKIGSGVNIKPKVNIKYPWKITIDDYAWIGENVWIDNLAPIFIGNSCCISQGAMLLCGNHNFKKTTFDLIVKPIIIEDGAWVGAKSVVCPGITLKKNSILTVGSIATTDLKENSIYQGNPAIKIKDRIIK